MQWNIVCKYSIVLLRNSRILIKVYSTDVEGIKYVINYDYPNSSEDYIHRIGRTGRSESTGTSYAFFTPANFRQAKDLVSVLQEANQVSFIKFFSIFKNSILSFWHAFISHIDEA